MARKLIWKRPILGGLKPTCSECNWKGKARRTLVQKSIKRESKETAIRAFHDHKCKDYEFTER